MTASSGKQWLRRLALSGVTLLIAAVAAVAITKSRQASAWDRAQAELFAKGERLSWDEFIPLPVPDNSNYFAHPVVRGLFQAWVRGALPPTNALSITKVDSEIAKLVPAGSSNLPQNYELPRQAPGSRPGPQRLSELRILPRSFEDQGTNLFCLEGLRLWHSQWNDVFQGFREAALRPAATLEGDYSDPATAPIPDFHVARQLAHVLASRAAVHLALGDRAAALEDLETLSSIMRGLRTQPQPLISAMIHNAILHLWLEVVGEGLRDDLWSDAELQAIQRFLRGFNPLAVVQTALRQSERTAALKFLDSLAMQPRAARAGKMRSIFTASSPSDVALLNVAPEAWIRRNQAIYALLMQDFIEAIDAESRRFDPDKARQANDRVAQTFSRWSPENMLAAAMTPNFEKAGAAAARLHAKLDQTLIVCALERYRKVHGQYPSSLSTLAPSFIQPLPKDLIGGEDYRYRADGHGFVLYSVGENGKDDGGIETGTGKQPDWIWNPNP